MNALRVAMTASMRWFPAVVVTWAAVMVTTVQTQCDPATQYLQDGQCCILCGPGTSMKEKNCLNPNCNPCPPNEYQDEHTSEEKCRRQPYCDPNKNFQRPTHMSSTKKSSCKCMLGFHCSSAECMTCVPHTTCEPGQRARVTGNHTHDTVCEECPTGTFSSVTSWNSICKEWSKCGDGYYVEKQGSAQADIICAETSRMHIALIFVLIVLVVIAICGILYWKCRGNVKETMKGCVGKTQAEEQMLPQEERETCIMMPDSLSEKDLPSPEPESTQEECSTLGHQTPEENLDEQTPNGLTENGNYVTQELGKSIIISRQESQSQSHTFTDSLISVQS